VRRITILIAAVGALLLVPAGQALAATFTIEPEGSGSGTVVAPVGFEEVGGGFGFEELECSGPPASGTCEQEFEGFLLGEEVTASAAPGSEFAGWTSSGSFLGNTCTGTSNLCEFTLNGSAVLAATFCLEGQSLAECLGGVELAVNVEEGSGTVVSSPAGIQCGATCTAVFGEGEKVTLTASPAAGYAFKSWKGCDTGGVNGRQCTVTMSSAKTVGVKFVKTYDLTAKKAGSGLSGLGKVQTSPGGILCLYNCKEGRAAFKEGTAVTVKQAAAKHNHFVKWLGDCTGSGETCTLSMTANHEVSAEFAPDTQHRLTISKSGGGQASIKTKPSGVLCGYTCATEVAYFYAGETVEITVKLNKGTTKLTWKAGFGEQGTCTGSTEALESTCTVPMSSDTSLTAQLS
jgi:hypothetical protein